MSKETKCPHCHQVGFHKFSCPTQKVTIWFDKDSLDEMYESVDKELSNAFIPTLEGDEAEEFIRKADEALKAEKTDWTLQSKRAERILEKSRIANRKLKYGKGEAPKVKRNKDVEP